VLRLAFGQAIKWHILDTNPAWDATPPAPKKAKNNALTTDDAMALLAYAETYQPTVNQCDRGKLLSIIILCMICGLRRGEAAGLRWDHVDLGRKVLTVTWSLGDAKLKGLDESLYPYVKHCRPVVRKGKQLEPGALILDTVKTPASDQVVPIPGFVVNFLRKRKVAYDTKKLQLGPAFHDDGFVMCGDNGDPFHPNGLYKNIVSLIACYNKDHPDAPLTRVTVHDLRHTFATMLLEGHQDVKVVSRSLRHANAAITRELYQHVTERLQNEATEYMETLLQPPQKTEMHKQA
jgi:integrase